MFHLLITGINFFLDGPTYQHTLHKQRSWAQNARDDNNVIKLHVGSLWM